MYRAKKQVSWMDDFSLTDRKGKEITRIHSDRLLVPKDYVVSHPNQKLTTRLRNQSKVWPKVQIQDGNKNKNKHKHYAIRGDLRRLVNFVSKGTTHAAALHDR